jgi:hypothetical protein
LGGAFILLAPKKVTLQQQINLPFSQDRDAARYYLLSNSPLKIGPMFWQAYSGLKQDLALAEAHFSAKNAAHFNVSVNLLAPGGDMYHAINTGNLIDQSKFQLVLETTPKLLPEAKVFLKSYLTMWLQQQNQNLLQRQRIIQSALKQDQHDLALLLKQDRVSTSVKQGVTGTWFSGSRGQPWLGLAHEVQDKQIILQHWQPFSLGTTQVIPVPHSWHHMAIKFILLALIFSLLAVSCAALRTAYMASEITQK